ncbi:NAD(P)H-dependent oxidoreductase [Desulfoprunum benzoelyticum]|uniref:Glutathione-regulated potassium-efflux system ancillary protein KefG n=2 Tax=Desulfoprunum benzoelyticum TaxID=1506996 RepID=A0A840USP6_9BACT|nr:NAD(P)H-dependent oxidoreductase [Desulfoprunum benzoelyticum]MBB5348675.1 glutathione-regulated potassium-efflux system ancillary protein KefG [Desulfoprunum benzoelyticum]MBM9530046.1 NAD(P)H-dependent oxidoreductase [Desulfoprunum benzoelyticum]
MKKILIIFAHPAIARSKINAAMRGAVEDLGGVTFHDLYAIYPDFLIDVADEQKLCQAHDVIIFQHPLYWYSTPAILKEWLDLVLQYGWAYGVKGRALEGKYFFQALTAGGDTDSYRKNGLNTFTIGELTAPYRATANTCRMEWLPPFTVLGMHRGMSDEEINRHAEEYRRVVTALRDGTFDMQKAKQNEYLNSNLDLTIRKV